MIPAIPDVASPASQDVLAGLAPPALAAFYGRLADAVDKNRGALPESLAARLLRHWLANRDPKSTYTFDAPAHLKNHSQVRSTLEFHRRVYLSQEKARFTGGVRKWAGVVPRLIGRAPFPKWAGTPPLTLDYQSLTEMPLRYQVTGDDADKDLLHALRGFQLKSSVVLTATKAPKGTTWRVTFQSFHAEVNDRYDWDYSEHLTVPNPDFGSKTPGAVAPSSKTVAVYHRNAERLERAGLAAPYFLRTNPWAVTDARVRASADVQATLRE
jgi:hypothetical protein